MIRYALLAVAFAAGFVTAWTIRTGHLSDLAAKHDRAVAESIERARRVEAEHRAVVDRARADLDAARARVATLDRDLFRRGVDVDRLRREVESAAARNFAPCAASDADRSAFGQLAAEGVGLLDEGRNLLRQCARDHDDRTAEIDALLDGWK